MLNLKNLLSEKKLNTVCEEASCPNIYECWSMGTATFMIMGDVCTRACGFCDVKTGKPGQLDLDEPIRVAESVKAMKLSHAVITSDGYNFESFSRERTTLCLNYWDFFVHWLAVFLH